MKEAAARIKINKLLENAGWRFFADAKGPANIQLEPSVTVKTQDLDALGENFEKSSKGFIDFLLLNEKSFPFIVLEAKSEDKSPLMGKEQARKYAKSQNCRFVILSNGNLHYFWDLERGNPYVITAFPTPKFEDTVRENDFIAASVEAGQWDRVIDYVNKELFDKPAEFYNLDKLRKAAAVDRRLTLREILEKIFGLIPRFKSKDELLEEEFSKFVADYKPTEAKLVPALKQFFKAYATDSHVRAILDDSKRLTELYTTTSFTIADLKAVPPEYRRLIPEYIKDYVSLNQFAA